MAITTGRFKPTTVTLATAYAEQVEEEFVIPADLSTLTDEELTKLNAEAVELFDSTYDAETMTDEVMEQLAQLTEGIEALGAEIATREAAKAERAANAAELAERVAGFRAQEEDEDEDTDEVDEDDPTVEEVEDENAAEVVTAAAEETKAKDKHVKLSRVPRKTPKAPAAPSMSSYAFDSQGRGTTWSDLGEALAKQLGGFNEGQYQAAAAAGHVLSQRQALATFNRNIPDELVIKNNDESHVEAVLNRAVDQSRLPKGGLVASGGWCTPSETLYDLLELETLDGLFSLPEVGIRRGGVKFTKGPSYQDIYAAITGFSFTEAEDIDGKYEPSVSGNVVGPKPTYHIGCPTWEEVRLEIEGMHITAGLLQNRTYPEFIARILRGAVVAREHRTNAALLNRVVAGSTLIEFDLAGGATTSILNAIELQVQHYRAVHRLNLNQTLEAVFPFWVRGVIRADLANRQGVDLISVPDSRINGWFSERGIAAQFTYNWQDLAANGAAATLAWPTKVNFLLYLAGTWVRGSQEIISVENLYDSVQLGQNNYTALFVEDGWAAIKRGYDSRNIEVTVPVDGAVGQAVAFELDGYRADEVNDGVGGSQADEVNDGVGG